MYDVLDIGFFLIQGVGVKYLSHFFLRLTFLKSNYLTPLKPIMVLGIADWSLLKLQTVKRLATWSLAMAPA